MYILNGAKNQIVNTDFVERFCIAEKNDATLILLSYSSGSECPPVTLARYKDAKEAQEALGDLFAALTEEQGYFIMPESRYYCEEKTIKDARTKRKGGS